MRRVSVRVSWVGGLLAGAAFGLLMPAGAEAQTQPVVAPASGLASGAQAIGSAVSQGLGPAVREAAQSEILGRDLADKVHQLQAERRLLQQPAPVNPPLSTTPATQAPTSGLLDGARNAGNGLGPAVREATHRGIKGRDLADYVHQLQAERRLNQEKKPGEPDDVDSDIGRRGGKQAKETKEHKHGGAADKKPAGHEHQERPGQHHGHDKGPQKDKGSGHPGHGGRPAGKGGSPGKGKGGKK